MILSASLEGAGATYDSTEPFYGRAAPLYFVFRRVPQTCSAAPLTHSNVFCGKRVLRPQPTPGAPHREILPNPT